MKFYKFCLIVIILELQLIISAESNKMEEFELNGKPYSLIYVKNESFSNNSFFISGNKGLLHIDGSIKIIDLKNMKIEFSFESKYPAVDISPNGEILLIYDFDENYYVYNLNTKNIEHILKLENSIDFRFYTNEDIISINSYDEKGIIFYSINNKKKEILLIKDEKIKFFELFGLMSISKDYVFYSANNYVKNKRNSFIFKFSIGEKKVIASKITDEFMIPLVEANGYIYLASDKLQVLNSSNLSTVKYSENINRIFHMSLSPSKKFLYVLSSFDGLFILERETLKIVKKLEVGKNANAFSMGVNFSADGKIACVATPYSETLSFIDVSENKVIKSINVGPTSGALILQDKCIVFSLLLPYE